MASQILIRDGIATGVYDDRFRPIYEALGVLNVERVTDVDFDPVSGDWIAKLLETGEEIGRGKDRGAVIKQEVRFLERKMALEAFGYRELIVNNKTWRHVK